MHKNNGNSLKPSDTLKIVHNAELTKLRDFAMKGDANAIALWALYVLEFELDVSDEFIAILENDDFQWFWIGKLACTLVRYRCNIKYKKIESIKYRVSFPDGTEIINWESIADGLSASILLAEDWYSLSEENVARDFLQDGELDISEYKSVLKEKEFFDFSIFTEPRIANLTSCIFSQLREIAEGYAEAQYILFLIGDTSEDWLEKAAENDFKMAEYRLECLNSPPRSEQEQALENKRIAAYLDIKKENRKLNSSLVQEKMLLQKSNQELLKKSAELEDVMAMFAHNFRGPVDSIIFNVEHHLDRQLLASIGNAMSGLLDIFSYISTSSTRLIPKLCNDNHGNTALGKIVRKSLWLALVQLLSRGKIDRMGHHYFSYLQRRGSVLQSVIYENWKNAIENLDNQKSLSVLWESKIGTLMDVENNDDVLDWCRQHLFDIKLNGVDESEFRCQSDGPKESVLVIVLTELFVNAIKYFDIASNKPLELRWGKIEDQYELSFCNPSSRNSRNRPIGSGRGHKFLALIAKNMGGKFIKPSTSDESTSTFIFPTSLFLGKPND